jgi:O-antigen ligase
MTAVLLLIELLLFIAAFAWFLHLERTGRPLKVIVVLVALLVVESALYYSPNEVAVGLFHPEIGNLSFRVFDALIPLAALARLLAGRRQLTPRAVALWLPFVVWMATAALLGAAAGNDLAFLTFEGKLVVYLLLIPLAAGVPAREYLESRSVRRLIVFSACLAALLTVTHSAGVRVSAQIPLLPLDQLGTLGSDLASIFVVMGILVLVVALVSQRGRGWGLVLALPLLIAPLAVGQRAALVALIVSIGVIALLLPFGQRHVRTTPTEIAIVVAVGVALLFVPTIAPAVSEGRAGSLPFSASISQALNGREKQLSGEDRVYQWRKARSLIAERPLFGWGLGVTYVSWDPGYFTFRENYLTHNIVGDLLLRTGAVGLLLFLIPVATTLGLAVRGWRTLIDPVMAALALGAGAALAGLLAKGLVESIFEKYRLSITLAILVGMIVALDRDLREPLPVTLRILEDSR